MTDRAVSWVIGSGGLLGSAVSRRLTRDGRDVRRVTVPWSDPVGAREALAEAAAEIVASERPWRVLWCAGAAVIGATQEVHDAEIAQLTGFVDTLDAGDRRATGSLFLASSAGGVHAGSVNPPFSEQTEPLAISPYGHAKLLAEDVVQRFSARSGVPVMIGRIANLYGPGQDVTKPQGLISQLCKAHLTRTPLSIYVSLDTSRDYIYVDDAARIVVEGTDRAAQLAHPEVVVKIIASQQGTTVAAILGELHRVTRRRPRVTLGASPLARFQIRDLRFRSVVWSDLDQQPSTNLPTGVSATLRGLSADLGAGRLAGRIA